MHPPLAGRRPLPAVALPADADQAAAGLASLGRPDDVALTIAHGAAEPTLRALLGEARDRGLLRLVLVGAGPEPPEADHVLVVDSDDPQVVREVHATVCHIVSELVHEIFLEHHDLLEDGCITCGDVAVQGRVVALSDHGAIIECDGAREEVAVDLVGDVGVGDVLLCHAGVAIEMLPDADAAAPPEAASCRVGPPAGLDAVLAEATALALGRGADAIALQRDIDLAAVESCGAAVRRRLDAGARLLVFGDGGAAAIARDAAADALRRGWPGVALAADLPAVTAAGARAVFERQLVALGRHGDVALAICTSGSSPHMDAALAEARGRGMLTCAVVAHASGAEVALQVDHRFVVSSGNVLRVQEAQATICHLLIDAIGGRT